MGIGVASMATDRFFRRNQIRPAAFLSCVAVIDRERTNERTTPRRIIRVLAMLKLPVFVLVCVSMVVVAADDSDKYRALREQCQRTPSKTECVQLKSKFVQLLSKCQKLQSKEQMNICRQVKEKLCSIFPSTCAQAKASASKSSTLSTSKSKPVVVTTVSSTVQSKGVVTSTSTASSTAAQADDEFVKVPIDPEALRTRGEYCVRHGKEKKCQELLNNLKTTYSTCKKKSPSAPTKPEQLDCHSFQGHLCKAFPKFPPCLKKPMAGLSA
jgi:hypothetical protein